MYDYPRLKMNTREIEDVIDTLSGLDISSVDKEEKEEIIYAINEIIVDLERLRGLFEQNA